MGGNRPRVRVRPVILSAEAQKLLRGQLESQRSEWVFPNPSGRPYTRNPVSKHFRRATRAAGLRNFRFHDLRHHGATMALNAGFSSPIVMALTDPTLRAAAEAVSGNEGWQRRAKLAPKQVTE
jgi:integrase